MSRVAARRPGDPSSPPPESDSSEAPSESRATAEEPSTAVDATQLSPEYAEAERLPSALDERTAVGGETATTDPTPSGEPGVGEGGGDGIGPAPAVPTPTTRRARRPADRDTVPSPGRGAQSADTERTVSAPSVEAPLDELGALPVVCPSHYDVQRVFARGGIGEISQARDLRLDRIVAIKELRRNTRYARLRFAREVSITARLQHPNIIPVYEAGRWPGGGPFLAMKLVDGGSLEEAIASRPSTQDRLGLVRHVADAADALAYSHSRAIVHRDLKPSNVLLGPFGETVVIDWGLAKALDDDGAGELPAPDAGHASPRYRTTDGVVMGTPNYMPPEQAAGPAVDARADVYALGAILYQVLCGRPPYFEAEHKHVLTRLTAGPPTSIGELAPEAPRDLRAIVHKAMARRAADRYPTAREMARELERFLTGGLVSAHRYSWVELASRFVLRHRTAVVTALLAATVVVAIAAYSFVRIAEQRDRAESSASAEARARRDAEERLAQAQLARARTAVTQDPTAAVAVLKALGGVVAGAATVAADAEQRGVARHVLRGHEDHVDAVAFSPDDRHLASVGSDGCVWIWDVRRGEGRRLGKHGDRAVALQYSPDGKMLVTGGYDRTLRIWDTATGSSRLLEGHHGAIKAIAIAPSGRLVASVGDDEVRVWELPSGEARSWSCPSDRSRFARFSTDGRRLLTGSHGAAMRVWDVATGEYRALEGHLGEVRDAVLLGEAGGAASVAEDGTLRIWPADGGAARVLREQGAGLVSIAATADGRHMVTGGLDGVVQLWDVETGQPTTVMQHRERVGTVAISADGRWVVSGSWDRTAALYDTETASLRRLLGHGDVISSVRLSPRGRWLASASWDRQIRLWAMEADGRRTLRGHRFGAKTVAWSPDASVIASGGHDDLVLEWDPGSGKLLRTHRGHTDHVFRVLFSPDGKWIASSSDDRTVRLWRTGAEESRVLDGHTADVEELCFAPDGTWLASAGEDSAVGIWEVASGHGQLLGGHRDAVSAVVCLPDSRTVASASADGTVRLWDASARRQVAQLTEHSGPVTALAASRDGEIIVSASPSDGVRWWNRQRQAGHLLGTQEPDGRQTVGADRVAISRDGALVAAAGPRGLIWLCPADGSACRRAPAHEARVHAMEFSGDGAHLITASGDGTLRIWSVQTGESRPLWGHAGPVFGLALAPGDRWIASASADGSIRIWPQEPPPAPGELGAWLAHLTTAEPLRAGQGLDAAATIGSP